MIPKQQQLKALKRRKAREAVLNQLAAQIAPDFDMTEWVFEPGTRSAGIDMSIGASVQRTLLLQLAQAKGVDR